jgi:hypothetical protein
VQEYITCDGGAVEGPKAPCGGEPDRVIFIMDEWERGMNVVRSDRSQERVRKESQAKERKSI